MSDFCTKQNTDESPLIWYLKSVVCNNNLNTDNNGFDINHIKYITI
jgi:hypothetical protein